MLNQALLNSVFGQGGSGIQTEFLLNVLAMEVYSPGGNIQSKSNLFCELALGDQLQDFAFSSTKTQGCSGARRIAKTIQTDGNTWRHMHATVEDVAHGKQEILIGG